MGMVSYLNGTFIDAGDLTISPYDLGLLRGYAVFDIMRTQNGKPFLFSGHWKRLYNSAKQFGLKLPVTEKEFAAVVETLLRLNRFQESMIKTVVTGGPSADGFSPAGKETFFIIVENLKTLPQDVYLRGAKVITLEHPRECPSVKSTNYMTAMKHSRERMKRGAIEILYTCGGKALEGSVSNLFIVKKGGLITPKEGILLGITRNFVIKLAGKLKLQIEERAIPLKELLKADEAFMTSSTRNIVPVVMVDRTRIGPGKVGPVTKAILEAAERYNESY
jgi:branched-subunit amino acid aminotransferase/4-amino-4-deoxychorismate lyase